MLPIVKIPKIMELYTYKTMLKIKKLKKVKVTFSTCPVRKFCDLYGCSFAQRCILKKQSRNRTKTRKNMFFLILFGFYHVFLTGRTAAKNNIQFQPYRSKFCTRVWSPIRCNKSPINFVSKNDIGNFSSFIKKSLTNEMFILIEI